MVFFRHLKSVIKRVKKKKKEYTIISFKDDHKQIISCDYKYLAAQIQI